MSNKPKITLNGTPNLQRLADEMARIRSRHWGVTVVATIIEQKKSPHSRQASSGHHRTIILYHTLATSEKRSCCSPFKFAKVHVSSFWQLLFLEVVTARDEGGMT